MDALYSHAPAPPAFLEALSSYFQATTPSFPSIPAERFIEGPLTGIQSEALRADLHGGRAQCAPFVYGHFVKRVLLLGAEGSGKTSLAAAMAERLGTRWAPEYAREYSRASAGPRGKLDFPLIARTQVLREEALAGEANRILFCDTGPLTSLLFARKYASAPWADLEELAARPYDLTVLCVPDFPLVQDGTRPDELAQFEQHRAHLDELEKRRSPYHLAQGPLGKRIEDLTTLLKKRGWIPN